MAFIGGNPTVGTGYMGTMLYRILLILLILTRSKKETVRAEDSGCTLKRETGKMMRKDQVTFRMLD